jgi:hypothetical protein
VIATLLLAACSGGDDPAPPSGGSPPPPPTATQAPTGSANGGPRPPAPPADLPPGVPATYGRDVEPGDLPPERLVPRSSEVTGTAFPGESTAIVTWSIGKDPFRREQGLVVWRRTPGAEPPWLATYAFREPPEKAVLGLQVDTADATGDGEADALVFASVGGSGVCGTWRLIALAPGEDDATFERDLCDATVAFSAAPVGLLVTELIFGPADPHCCPSGSKTSTLVWRNTRWRVAAVDRSAAD